MSSFTRPILALATNQQQQEAIMQQPKAQLQEPQSQQQEQLRQQQQARLQHQQETQLQQQQQPQQQTIRPSDHVLPIEQPNQSDENIWTWIDHSTTRIEDMPRGNARFHFIIDVRVSSLKEAGPYVDRKMFIRGVVQDILSLCHNTGARMLCKVTDGATAAGYGSFVRPCTGTEANSFISETVLLLLSRCESLIHAHSYSPGITVAGAITTPQDVIFSDKARDHEGNARFRLLLKQHVEWFRNCESSGHQSREALMYLVFHVRACGGRFLVDAPTGSNTGGRAVAAFHTAEQDVILNNLRLLALNEAPPIAKRHPELNIKRLKQQAEERKERKPSFLSSVPKAGDGTAHQGQQQQQQELAVGKEMPVPKPIIAKTDSSRSLMQQQAREHQSRQQQPNMKQHQRETEKVRRNSFIAPGINQQPQNYRIRGITCDLVKEPKGPAPVPTQPIRTAQAGAHVGPTVAPASAKMPPTLRSSPSPAENRSVAPSTLEHQREVWNENFLLSRAKSAPSMVIQPDLVKQPRGPAFVTKQAIRTTQAVAHVGPTGGPGSARMPPTLGSPPLPVDNRSVATSTSGQHQFEVWNEVKHSGTSRAKSASMGIHPDLVKEPRGPAFVTRQPIRTAQAAAHVGPTVAPAGAKMPPTLRSPPSPVNRSVATSTFEQRQCEVWNQIKHSGTSRAQSASMRIQPELGDESIQATAIPLSQRTFPAVAGTRYIMEDRRNSPVGIASSTGDSSSEKKKRKRQFVAPLETSKKSPCPSGHSTSEKCPLEDDMMWTPPASSSKSISTSENTAMSASKQPATSLPTAPTSARGGPLIETPIPQDLETLFEPIAPRKNEQNYLSHQGIIFSKSQPPRIVGFLEDTDIVIHQANNALAGVCEGNLKLAQKLRQIASSVMDGRMMSGDTENVVRDLVRSHSIAGKRFVLYSNVDMRHTETTGLEDETRRVAALLWNLLQVVRNAESRRTQMENPPHEHSQEDIKVAAMPAQNESRRRAKPEGGKSEAPNRETPNSARNNHETGDVMPMDSRADVMEQKLPASSKGGYVQNRGRFPPRHSLTRLLPSHGHTNSKQQLLEQGAEPINDADVSQARSKLICRDNDHDDEEKYMFGTPVDQVDQGRQGGKKFELQRDAPCVSLPKNRKWEFFPVLDNCRTYGEQLKDVDRDWKLVLHCVDNPNREPMVIDAKTFQDIISTRVGRGAPAVQDSG